MGRGIAALLLAPALLSACGGGDAAPRPPDPPADVLSSPERRPWGDAVAGRVNALSNHIHGSLGARYGAVDQRSHLARDPAAVAALEGWYRARLGAGWRAEPLSLLPGEQGFAFTSGARAFAVGWIGAMPDGGIPVVTMRYGEER